MNPIFRIATGAVVGALVGLAMYKFVGCRGGACPLTGNPFIAMSLWGVMGAMLASGS